MKVWTILFTVVWAAGIVSGGFALAHHQWAPGASAAGTPSKLGAAAHQKPRILVFLHPQCSCSHATVAELAKILTVAHGSVNAELFFYRPKTEKALWSHSSLWDEAAELPGAALRDDPGGAQAAEFGAHTSGQVLLYSGEGRLVFSGGITDGRGHEGDNDGEDAIIGYLSTGRVPRSSTPVFGCVIG